MYKWERAKENKNNKNENRLIITIKRDKNRPFKCKLNEGKIKRNKKWEHRAEEEHFYGRCDCIILHSLFPKATLIESGVDGSFSYASDAFFKCLLLNGTLLAIFHDCTLLQWTDFAFRRIFFWKRKRKSRGWK